MAEKELYISIDLEEYKRNKSNTLQAQAEVLKSVKHLNNLKYFYSQETKLKQRLQKSFETITFAIGKIEEDFPDAKLPKQIQEKIAPVQKILQQEKMHEKLKVELNEKHSSIDLELQEIQAKLRALNK